MIRTLILAAMLAWAGAAHAAGMAEIMDFSPNPGELRMVAYAPEGLPPSRPLVVALHGCSQEPEEFAADTGWMGLADEHGFALLLPGQRRGNNLFGCFNWFLEEDQAREGGEAESIRHMVARMIRDHRLDPARVFVTGLSAGGAMTAIMLANYPNVFAAGGIVAGVPFGCAGGALSGVDCMLRGRDKTPAEWAALVREATGFAGPWPRVSIWQGEEDGAVVPLNARELVEQWTELHAIDRLPDDGEAATAFRHEVYGDAEGAPQVEFHSVPGMGHGIPVDPARGCGEARQYILDVGLCAAARLVRFWRIALTSGASH